MKLLIMKLITLAHDLAIMRHNSILNSFFFSLDSATPPREDYVQVDHGTKFKKKKNLSLIGTYHPYSSFLAHPLLCERQQGSC